MKILLARWWRLFFDNCTRLNFSLYKREIKFYKQRKDHGFDETDLWNLDLTIVNFILPKLPNFSIPPSDLNKMIKAYNGANTDEYFYKKEYNDNLDEANKLLFIKYFDLINVKEQIVDFILPRLKQYENGDYFEDDLEIDKMIYCFENILKDKSLITRAEQLKIEKGMKIFVKNFRGLWT